MGMLIRAPWTRKEVRALRARQMDETRHEYTCTCSATLLPTKKGWWCPTCKAHVQDWAHDVDVRPPAKMGLMRQFIRGFF